MRLFVILGGLVVTVLVAALVAPLFIDWTGYRARFEAEASRLIGQPVRVAGDASARLIPFPSVTFTDVEVGPSAAPVMRARRFSMDAELAPFLQGRVLIFDMRVEEPQVTLTLDERGVPVWPERGEAPVDPARIALENARISGATITLVDPREDRSVTLTDLDATVAASSLFGPWRATGTARAGPQPVAFTVSTGSFAPEGFTLSADLALPSLLMRMTSDGRIGRPREDAGVTYDGRFTIRPDGDMLDWRVEGEFSADARAVEATEFRADFGDPDDPYRVTGSAAIAGGARPSYRIEARGNPITMGGESPGTPGTALGDRLAAANTVLAGLPFPTIAGTIDLDLPAVMIDGVAIRNLQVSARPALDGNDRRLDIRRVAAELPGRTQVEASGRLDLPAPGQGLDAAVFEGDVLVASRQPSGLSQWLTGRVDEAIRAIPQAGFSAQVALSADEQRAQDAEIIAGPMRLTGTIERKGGPVSPPWIRFALTGNDVEDTGLAALAAAVSGLSGDDRARHDADFDLAFDGVSLSGLAAGRVEATGRLRGPRLEIDRFLARDMDGVTITATASGDLDAARSRADALSFDASVIGAEGADFAQRLAGRFAGHALADQLARVATADRRAFSDLQVNAVGSARRGDDGMEVSASLSGTAGGATVFVSGTSPAEAGEPTTLSGTISHDDSLRLLSWTGFAPLLDDGASAGLGAAGELGFSFAGTGDGSVAGRAAISAGSDRVSIDGTWRADGSLAGGLASLSLSDGEPWLSAYGLVLPGTGLGTPAALVAELSGDADGLSVSGLSGTVAEVPVTGDLVVSDGGARIAGTVFADALDGDLLAALATGHVDAMTRETVFAPPLFAGTGLQIALSARRLSLLGRSFDNASANIGWSGGLLSVDDFTGMLGTVPVSGQARAQNAGGTVSVTARGRAAGLPLSAVSAAVPAVETALVLDGEVTASGRTPAALLAGLAGSGVVSTGPVRVTGLSPDAYGVVIAQADRRGFGITPDDVRAMAKVAVSGAETRLAPVEAPLVIASGVASLANLSTATADGALAVTGTVTLDLASGEPGGQVTVTYDAGEEAVAGTSAAVDFAIGPGADGIASAEPGFAALEAHVTQRALEIEQDRVERLQSRLLERQRLRRAARMDRFERREAFAIAEEARLRAIAAERLAAIREAERIRAEEEARRAAEEEARRAAEEEAKRLAEEAARLAAEEEARKAAEEEARRAAEDEARRAEEERRRRETPPEPAPAQAPAVNPVDSALIRDPFAPLPQASPDPVGDLLNSLQLDLPRPGN